MLFAIFALDKPGAEQVRLDNRPAHVEYLKANGTAVVRAGPLQSNDGKAMIGSLLVVDMADRAAVEDFCANDPYAKADLFESVQIKRWKQVIPAS